MTTTLRRAFVGPVGYVLLAVVLAVALFIGATGKSVSSDAARIAHLESVIRCPSCEDLSIADSETTSAVGLRTEVVKLVGQGLSDAAIEARVEEQFPGTLLVPSGGAGVAVFLIPLVVIALGGALLGTFLARRRTQVAASGTHDDATIVAAALEKRTDRS